MIGAVPNTEWLKEWIQLDSNGYIVTDHTPFLRRHKRVSLPSEMLERDLQNALPPRSAKARS